MSLFSHPLRLSVLLLNILFLSPTSAVFAEADPAALISHGGFAVTRAGAIISSHNLDVSFTPASTIKIVTCLAALHSLGADYRFTTDFFVDSRENLYIKGSGDPYLTSEAVAAIALALRQQGIRRVRSIILDASLFTVRDVAEGSENSTNPYDVLNSALAVNFNSLPIEVLADRSVVSAEKETPLLPIMRDIGRQLAPGTHRVNPMAFPSKNPMPATLRYTGELFEAMLTRQGIRVTGSIATARVPQGLSPIYRHISEKTVEDLVRYCLQYSNNFLANQLFLACGGKTLGWPASWQKGRQAMRAFIDSTWPHSAKAITMVEGSGLSRRDSITPAAMLEILKTFKPYAGLMKTTNGIPLKSGSLAGVHCYAGYLTRGEDRDPFVILLNQKENVREEILADLQKVHAGRP